MVVSLPKAFSTIMSLAGTPARSSAFFRYGASKCAHRIEDCVSGSRKATLPLPAAAMGFSMDIVEKLLLKLKAAAGTEGAVAAPETLVKPVSKLRPATVAAKSLTTAPSAACLLS